MPILNTPEYGIVAFSPQQPHNPMGDLLEWATDVFPAHDGTEYRNGIRQSPRRIIEMNYPIQGDDNARNINAIYAGLNRDWLVPVWTSARYVSAIGATDTNIVVDTNAPDSLIPGGYALVWASNTEYAIVNITGFTGNGVSIAEAIDFDMIGVYIVPMRKGRITGKPQRTTTGHTAVFNVKFDVEDESPTIDICVAFDVSFSMETISTNGQSRLTNMKNGIVQALGLLGDMYRYKFNVMLNAWGETSSTFTRLISSSADVTALQSFVAGRTYVSGTNFNAALNGVASFFSQSNSARRVFIFITDGEPNDVATATQAAATLKAIPNVISYAFNIELDNIAYTSPMDNTPADGVPVFTGSDTNGISAAIAGAMIGIPLGRFLNADLDTSGFEAVDGKVVEEYDGGINTVDYETGKRAYFAPWLNPKIGKTQRVTMMTAEEASGFRAWCERRAGRLVPFWRPTFERDFKLVSTGVLGTTIQVRDDDFNQFGGVRKHIAIKLANGQWFTRTISAYVGKPNFIVELTLDSALNINAKDVDYICYLGLHRLNTDRIETSWNNGIAVSEFTTIEINP